MPQFSFDDPETNKALHEATRGVSEFLQTGRAPQLSIVGEVPPDGTPPTAIDPEHNRAGHVDSGTLGIRDRSGA